MLVSSGDEPDKHAEKKRRAGTPSVPQLSLYTLSQL